MANTTLSFPVAGTRVPSDEFDAQCEAYAAGAVVSLTVEMKQKAPEPELPALIDSVSAA